MLAALPLLTALSLAPTPTLDVAWQLPPECPKEHVVDAQLHALVATPQTPTRAEVTITAIDGPAWRLELLLEQRGETLRRRVEHGSCEVLARTAVMILAIQLSPVEVTLAVGDAVLAAPPQAETPAPPPDHAAPPPQPPDHAAPPPQPPARVAFETPPRSTEAARGRAPPSARPRRPLRGAIRLQGALGLAALPSLDAGGGLTLALLGRRLRIELTGAAWAPATLEHPTLPVSGTLRFWSGGVRAGAFARVGAVELHLHGLVEVGALTASATPLANAVRQTAAWLGIGLAAGLAWPVHRVIALWIGAEGFGVPVRPRFTIGNLGEFYEARPAGFRGVLGVEARFP
ncbi:MAG: hypothetical protein KC636_01145 [Myxococcales bacterium]|nr:hypothetical protein [Myxococcales bacterium]